MKVIIWGVTIVISTVINALIGYFTGIKAGAFLLYLIEIRIAKNWCARWESRKAMKNEATRTEQTKATDVLESEMTLEDTVDGVTTGKGHLLENPQMRFCRHCGYQFDVGSKFCSNCGAKVIVYTQPKAALGQPEEEKRAKNAREKEREKEMRDRQERDEFERKHAELMRTKTRKEKRADFSAVLDDFVQWFLGYN